MQHYAFRRTRNTLTNVRVLIIVSVMSNALCALTLWTNTLAASENCESTRCDFESLRFDEIRRGNFALASAMAAVDRSTATECRRRMSQANESFSLWIEFHCHCRRARTVIFAFRCKTARLAISSKQKGNSNFEQADSTSRPTAVFIAAEGCCAWRAPLGVTQS